MLLHVTYVLTVYYFLYTRETSKHWSRWSGGHLFNDTNRILGPPYLVTTGHTGRILPAFVAFLYNLRPRGLTSLFIPLRSLYTFTTLFEKRDKDHTP